MNRPATSRRFQLAANERKSRNEILLRLKAGESDTPLAHRICLLRIGWGEDDRRSAEVLCQAVTSARFDATSALKNVWAGSPCPLTCWCELGAKKTATNTFAPPCFTKS